MALVPVLVATHVTLALCLLVPSLVLPFAFRAGRLPRSERRSVVRGLLAVQARTAAPIALAVALSGAALVVALGPSLLAQPWLLAALAIYGANLVLAFFVQRPNLLGLVGPTSGDQETDGRRPDWPERARRQRYVSYAMAGLTGTIGFLMSAKPALW